MLNDPTLTDLLVDQACASEPVTALILLLVKKGPHHRPEYEAALQEVVSARLLEADNQTNATPDEVRRLEPSFAGVM